MRRGRPFCVNCEAKPARLLGREGMLGTPDERYFCSLKCAADWAIVRVAAQQEWCGKRYETGPYSDVEGPHGWYSIREYPDGCPECDAEADEEKATA